MRTVRTARAHAAARGWRNRWTRAAGAVALWLLFGALPVNRAAAGDVPEGLLASALVALKQGKLQSARELLQSAYQQSPKAHILCHLGALAMRQGMPVQGHDLFRRCLSDAADAGERLPPELETEARAATLAQPQNSGELIAISNRGGPLWVDDLLMANLRPGGSVQLTLPAGPHELRLGAARQSGVTLSIQIQAQTVTEADFDHQQFVSSAPILLLPLDRHGARSLEGPDASALFALLTPLLRKENGLILGLPRQRALYRQQQAQVRCGARFACQLQLGKLVDATFVLALQLEPWPYLDAAERAARRTDGATRDYQLTAWLIEAHAEKETAREEQTCSQCSHQMFERSLSELVLRVFAKGRQPARMIEVVSRPPAELLVDGERRGQTPRRLWLLPGKHEIELRRPYFTTRREHLTVDEDAAERVPTFALELTPAPLSRGELATRYAAGVSGGVGLAALAVGLGLLFRPDVAVPPQAAMADMPETPGFLSTTHPPGLGLTIAGGALLVTSAVLWGVDGYRRAQRKHR